MPVRTQQHIHLGLASGGSLPALQWRTIASDRAMMTEKILSANRSLTGKLHVHYLPDPVTVSKPKVYRNYGYTIVVKAENGQTAEQRLETLLSMDGCLCYLIDHIHPNDNENHSGYARLVLLEVGEIAAFDPLLTRYNVPVKMMDAS
jgi:ribosomal protein L17